MQVVSAGSIDHFQQHTLSPSLQTFLLELRANSQLRLSQQSYEKKTSIHDQDGMSSVQYKLLASIESKGF